MKNGLQKTWIKIIRHKIYTAILLIIIVLVGYYAYGKLYDASAETKYVLAYAKKGTIISTISGSGQVSALNQVDIKPEVSGEIIYVYKQNGQYVSKGDAMAKIDADTAEKSIRDAEMSLESAKLQLSILKESSANISKLTADGFNEVADTFLDLPEVIAGIDSALHDSTIMSYQNLIDAKDFELILPLINAAEASYKNARTAYDKAFANYHSVSRYDSEKVITDFMIETSDTATKISDAIKNSINIIDFVNDYNTQHNRKLTTALSNLVTAYRTNLINYTSKVNPHITSLASIQSSINNAPLNVASQELSLKQKENTLADAKDALADYIIRAPFGGVIAKMNVRAGDMASPSVSAATLVTTRKMAEISLNEVDVAKIKVGQKAEITFDAIDGLKVLGEVTEIDTIGTVTQGVVNYGLKIGFNSEDSRVKPGMSVSVLITTNTKENVLIVPNSAVKSQSARHYVETLAYTADNSEQDMKSAARGVVSETAPEKKFVEIGEANDSMTEIISGLNEGDAVVTRTVAGSSAAQQQTQSASTGLRLPGIGGVR